MIDVIFFAIVAVLLFLKLKSILGKEDESAPKRSSVSGFGISLKNFKDMKDVTNLTKDLSKSAGERKQSEIDEEIAQNLLLIDKNLEPAYRMLCPTFPFGVLNIKGFFDTMEALFVQLIDARNQKSLTQVTFNLSKELSKKIAILLEDEKIKHPNQKIEIVKVNLKLLDIKAEKDGNAIFTIEVSSSQIRYSKDGDTVTSGSITVPQKFIDLFTIKRVLQNKLYVWTLIDMQ